MPNDNSDHRDEAGPIDAPHDLELDDFRPEVDDEFIHHEAWLAGAWSLIPDERDCSWVDIDIASAEMDPDAPYSGGGLALQSLLAKGATREELTELVRSKLAEFLFQIAYRLEDPMHNDPKWKNVLWGLFVIDDDGNPIRPLTGLHESVLQADPTDREARRIGWEP